MEYLTTYYIGKEAYGDSVFADSWDEAKDIAKLRGKGEIVDGVLRERTEITV